MTRDDALEGPQLGQVAQQGEWIEPGRDAAFETAPEPEVSSPLSDAVAAIRDGVIEAAKTVSALPRPVLLGAAGGAGLAVLWMATRSRRPRRSRPAHERIAVELGRQIMHRVVLAAATTAATRIAQDLVVPMMVQRLTAPPAPVEEAPRRTRTKRSG